MEVPSLNAKHYPYTRIDKNDHGDKAIPKHDENRKSNFIEAIHQALGVHPSTNQMENPLGVLRTS